MRRSLFNLSYYKLLTMNMGNLVPIGLKEIIPGDKFRVTTTAMVRVSPLVHPVMHPVHAKIHHWFVPKRLVMASYDDFLTGGEDGDDATVTPKITFAGSGISEGSLADYLGLPPNANSIDVNAEPFRAYALTWNEYYRDQDLQNKIGFTDADGTDSTTNTTLQSACWAKDYFTVARAETQKGDEITIPLGTTAPITATGQLHMEDSASDIQGLTIDTNNSIQGDGVTPGGIRSLVYDSGLETDLSNATAATINQWREAIAYQQFAENRSLWGSRYSEMLLARGVTPLNAELQRPLYLGGGKTTIQFSEVLQTAPNATAGTSDSDGVGDLKGHGIASLQSNAFQKSFHEHGWLLTLMHVQPVTMYTQGAEKHWWKNNKFDYHTPELEGLGQQAIEIRELYVDAADPDGTFGYADNFDEYRRSESTVSGEFRSTRNSQHMARIFGSEPSLNASFVQCDPTTRVFQATSADQLQVMAYHKISAIRPVSKVARPAVLR